MNQTSEPTDQLLLDQFAEGDLTEAQEQEVLLRLDSSPADWRRLALAMIEARRWQREFRALAAEADCPAVGQAASLPRGGSVASWQLALRRRLSGRLTLFFVAASGLLAAFVLGLALGMQGQGEPAKSHEFAGATRPESTVQTANPSTPADEEDRSAVPVPAAPQVLCVAYREPGSEVVRYFDVPVVDPSQVPIQVFENPPPAVPVVLKQALEQSGYEVTERPRVEPVQLADGREMVLLGTEAEVRYVGRSIQ